MEWVTIHKVTTLTDAQVIVAQLEIEGIKVYSKEEGNIKADIFNSNDLEGVQIQVPQDQAKKAFDLLVEWEYIQEPTEENETFLNKIYRLTAKVPIVNKLIPELRLLVIVGTTLLLVAFTIYFAQPSAFDKLPNSLWCIDYIEYKQVLYEPYTDEFIGMRLNHQCEEGMKIESNYISLPGFNTTRIQSAIDLNNGILTILNCDILGHIFNGEYQVNFDGNQIIMTSPTTTIWGFKQKEFSLPLNY